MEDFEFKLTTGKPVFADCEYYPCVFDYLSTFDGGKLPSAGDLQVNIYRARRIKVNFSLEDYLFNQIDDLNMIDLAGAMKDADKAINATINSFLKTSYEATFKKPTMKSLKAVLKAFKQSKKSTG